MSPSLLPHCSILLVARLTQLTRVGIVVKQHVKRGIFWAIVIICHMNFKKFSHAQVLAPVHTLVRTIRTAVGCCVVCLVLLNPTATVCLCLEVLV